MKIVRLLILVGGLSYGLLLFVSFIFSDSLNIHDQPGMSIAFGGILSIGAVIFGVILGFISLIKSPHSLTRTDLVIVATGAIGLVFWFLQ